MDDNKTINKKDIDHIALEICADTSITDVKYENGHLQLVSSNGKTFDLGPGFVNLCDDPDGESFELDYSALNDCKASCNTESMANCNSFVSDGVYADSCAASVASHPVNGISTPSNITVTGTYYPTETVGIYHPTETIPSSPYTISIGTTGVSASHAVLSTVPKQFFIQDQKNFNWIASKFAKRYISEVTSTKKPSDLLPRIKFFGVSKGEPTVLLVKLDALKESIKEFFQKAANIARDCGFSELFGPITEDASMEDYVRKLEDDGIFMKELYDFNCLLELSRRGALKINAKIRNSDNIDRLDRQGVVDEEDEESWFSSSPFFDSKVSKEIEIPEEVDPEEVDGPKSPASKSSSTIWGKRNENGNISSNITSVLNDTWKIYDNVLYTAESALSNASLGVTSSIM